MGKKVFWNNLINNAKWLTNRNTIEILLKESMVFLYVYLFLKSKQISKGIEFNTFKTRVMNLLMKHFKPIEFDGVKIGLYA